MGEVMLMWTYEAALEAVRSTTQLMLNHTNHTELKELMEHLVNDLLETQNQQLTSLMRDEGIQFPPANAEIPKADEKAIPPGAKFTDLAIGNRLVADLEGLLLTAHGALTQGLRDDIIALFYRFHQQLLAQSFTLKKLMDKQGWLRIPPFYYAGQSPRMQP